MTKNELSQRYFDWMYRLVYDIRYTKRLSYRKLLSHFNDVDFTYILPLDDNRAADGIDLRYRFGYEEKHINSMIASYLDDRPCSVLEMLVALSLRCEEHIMDDIDIGNRTGQWFWYMVESLQLGSMSDNNYDEALVDNALMIFLTGKYERDGTGGLFVIKECKRDLRTIDIWYQMCLYLSSIITFT